jgi:hypothetical protein
MAKRKTHTEADIEVAVKEFTEAAKRLVKIIRAEYFADLKKPQPSGPSIWNVPVLGAVKSSAQLVNAWMYREHYCDDWDE